MKVILSKIAKIPSFFKWVWSSIRRKNVKEAEVKIVAEIKETIEEVKKDA